MPNYNALRIVVGLPGYEHVDSRTFDDKASKLAPAGKYTYAEGVTYHPGLQYITLQHYIDYRDTPASSWNTYNINYDPFSGYDVNLRPEELISPDKLSTCKPQIFAEEFSSLGVEVREAVIVPTIGVVQYKSSYDVNQPFTIFVWSHHIHTTRSPNPLPFIRIYWGTAPAPVRESWQEYYKGSIPSSHPNICGQWAIDLNRGDQDDLIWLNMMVRSGGSDEDPEYMSLWRAIQKCKIVPPSGGGARAGVPIVLRIEPFPPASILITDLVSGEETRASAYTIEEVEWAHGERHPYYFWDSGHVAVQVQGSSIVYTSPIRYETSGYYLSKVFDLGKPNGEKPVMFINRNTPVEDSEDSDTPREWLKGNVPGMIPTGTSLSVELWDPDKDQAFPGPPRGEEGYQRFRYKVSFTGDGTKTPYVKNVLISNLITDREDALNQIEATPNLLGARINKTIDDSRRSAEITLDNTSGKYNHLKRVDSSPIWIFIDDKMIFRGYTTSVSEELVGRNVKMEEEEEFIPPSYSPGKFGVGGRLELVDRHHRRILTVKLSDRWKKLDHNLLTQHLGFACDGSYHNVAIFNLLRWKAGFDPETDFDTPTIERDGVIYPKIVTSENKEPGQLGESLIMISDYSSDTPTWVPNTGEPMTSFINQIHESFGLVRWEMFFDEEGKFYYQPQYIRREYKYEDDEENTITVPQENKFTFVEQTRDVTDSDHYPILGRVVMDIDWSGFRNMIWVAGQFRSFQEVMGHANYSNDPFRDTVPIYATLALPQSWNDPDFEFYVGEIRPMLIFNPALVTMEQVNYMAAMAAYRCFAPKRIFRLKSYYIPDLRPGHWGTLKYLGMEYTVRVRSISNDFSVRIGGDDPKYYGSLPSGQHPISWLSDYEVEVVLPWEEW